MARVAYISGAAEHTKLSTDMAKYDLMLEPHQVVPEHPGIVAAVLLEIDLSDEGAFETVQHVADKYPSAPVVVLSPDQNPRTHGQCVSLGAYQVVSAPARAVHLASALRQAIGSTQKDPNALGRRIGALTQMAYDGLAASH